MADVVEELLVALRANPRAAPKLLNAATNKAEAAVYAALRTDKRFGPPLREAVRDSRVLGEAPWLVQFLGHLKFAPAIPELLAVWHKHDARVSYQAGHALVQIGQRAALEALVADLENTFGTETHIALGIVLGDVKTGRAYDRLAPLVVGKHAHASAVLYRVAELEAYKPEPRWKALALDVLREKGASSSTLDAAQTLLRKAMTAAELRAALPPEAAKKPDSNARQTALARAREAIAKIAAGLPKGAMTPAKKPALVLAKVAKLEALIGPLPAMVRAFHELGSRIEIRAKASKDRFIVYSLDEVLEEARAWAKTYDVAKAPSAVVPRFLVPVAPDGYTKADFSGGPPIGFEMPTDEDDPPLLHARRRPRFSTFLARATRR